MDYVFERGRVQKQLPGRIPSPLTVSPPKVSQESTMGKVKLLGLFLDRELCMSFIFLTMFLLAVGPRADFQVGF